jgi:hypothetical protein
MSDAQRAFWIDLLALGGRSRFPGVICAGRDGKKLVGYPLSKFLSLMAEPIDIEETLKLFARTGKIKVSVTSDGPPKLFVIELLNWKKYQSSLDAQAERARRYRSRKKERHANITPNATPKSHDVTPVEEKEDRHGVKERKRIESAAAEAAAAPREGTTAATAADQLTVSAFESLKVKPFGPRTFQAAWTKRYDQIPNSEPASFVEAMESTIQDCEAIGTKPPAKFFALKREIEKLEVGQCFRRNLL